MSEKDIYTELQNSLNVAINTVNDYSFKKEKETPQDIMNKKFSEVSNKKSELNEALEKLYSLRNAAYSTYLSGTAAIYYKNKIEPYMSEVKDLIDVQTLIKSDDFKEALSQLKGELYNLQDMPIAYTKIRNAAKTLAGYTAIYQRKFAAYSGLEMDFGISEITSDKMPTISLDKSKKTCKDAVLINRENGDIIEVNGPSTLKKYIFSHILKLENENISSLYKLSIPNTTGLYGECTFDSMDFITKPFNADSMNLKLWTTNSDFYFEDGSVNFPYRVTSSTISKIYEIDSDQSAPKYFVFDGNEGDHILISRNLPFGYYGTADNKSFVLERVSTNGDKNDFDDLFGEDNYKPETTIFGIQVNPAKQYFSNKLSYRNVVGTYSSKLSLKKISANTEIPLSLILQSSNNIEETFETPADYKGTTFTLVKFRVNLTSRSYALIVGYDAAAFTLTGNIEAESGTSLSQKFNLLYYLKDLERLTDFNKKQTADEIINLDNISEIKFFRVNEYLLIISKAENSISKLEKELTDDISAKLTQINKMASSYISIEGNRQSNDSSYISDYTNDTLISFSDFQSSVNSAGYSKTTESITSGGTSGMPGTSGKPGSGGSSPGGSSASGSGIFPNISTIGGSHVQVTLPTKPVAGTTGTLSTTTTIARRFYEIDFQNISGKFTDLGSKSYELLSDAESAIKELTKKIDQYSPFYRTSVNYSEKLENSLKVFYDEIMSADFSFPNSTRPYKSWVQEIQQYTGDGTYNLALMYISQELGILANECADLDKKYDYKDIFVSLFNFAFADSTEKGLWAENAIADDYKLILNAENLLRENYGIIINELANYEKVNPRLKAMIPSLEGYEKIDISKLLSGMEPIDGKEFRKIQTYCENIFIPKIFEDKNNDSSAMLSLKSVFESNKLNFRTYLLKYFFVECIIKIYNAISDDGSKFYATVKSLANEYTSNDSTGILTSLKDGIVKYQAVYSFMYTQENYMIIYFDTEKDVGQSLYRFMITNTGDYRIDETKKKEAEDGFITFFKNIWNFLSDAFSSLFNR